MIGQDLKRPKVLLPSGEMVMLEPDEERELAKDVLREREMSKHLMFDRVQGSIIDAGGTALGLALGGLLVAYFIGRKL